MAPATPRNLHASPQVIVNKLWLGLDLGAAIAAPILHVDDQGQVEFEPHFPQVRLWAEPPPPGGTPWSALPKPLQALCRAHGSARHWRRHCWGGSRPGPGPPSPGEGVAQASRGPAPGTSASVCISLRGCFPAVASH